MKNKVLSAAQKKALALDIKLGKLKDKQLAEKYKITTRTVERARKKLKEMGPKSVLTMKRALDLIQAQSMLIYYLETLERLTAVAEADNKMPMDKKMEQIRENMIATLNIHNSLASFIDIPDDDADYGDMEVKLVEAVLTLIPEDRRDELNAKISELTKKENRPEDPIQQDGRPETGAIPEKPG